MCYAPDSYSAAPAVFLLFCMYMCCMELSERSERHIKTGFSSLNSLYSFHFNLHSKTELFSKMVKVNISPKKSILHA